MNQLKRINGFSMVELIIVILILACLTSIGIPSYIKFKRKADLSEATTTLITINQNITKLKVKKIAGNITNTDISSEISKNINENIKKNFDVNFSCAKEKVCFEYYLFAKPKENSSIKEGVWLSSNDKTTYLCSKEVEFEVLTDAAKNNNCSEQ